MDRRQFQQPRKSARISPRLMERLVYLPGALLLVYGLWLSMTV